MPPSPPTPAETLSVVQFAQCLADSGLMTPDEIKSLASRVPPAQRGDCRPFAQQLVKQNKLPTDNVTDLSPVRALKGLQDLRCYGSDNNRGRLTDLSPLHGMSIRFLNCGRNPGLSALGPLKGLPLQRLNVNLTGVADLTPLAKMNLDHLDITATRVRDLTPLAGMPMAILRMRRAPIDDLAPLRGLPIVEITLDPKGVRDLDVLRSMPNLRYINDAAAGPLMKKLGK